MQNLQTLSLDRNKLTTLPKEIENLQSLESLDLSNNPLKSFPEEIGKLQHLKRLRLENIPTLLPQKEKIRKLLPNVTIDFGPET
ncbi:leucine rich repeat protein [Leptospira santarosai str. CBC1416]|uniref:Leucine rich repeat protein n=1 Tax=Leptospira santarosai str. CBC1416 TaxID=1193059 RepID=M6VS36_9LEPT|nr:leucine rich repeat protein [Leptospira santarosai str. CBC1416]